jgi:hypothetical protein
MIRYILFHAHNPYLTMVQPEKIIGPGGQSVYTDGDGPILVYHYYTSAGSRLGELLMNRLVESQLLT